METGWIAFLVLLAYIGGALSVIIIGVMGDEQESREKIKGEGIRDKG